mmetsp:Transcript_62022/g.130979  ORF Transcript_62022/g.130979 Transcript_62022/m.130979 type:complete len:198 (+) Transcript_62022:101-694(+)
MGHPFARATVTEHASGTHAGLLKKTTVAEAWGTASTTACPTNVPVRAIRATNSQLLLPCHECCAREILRTSSTVNVGTTGTTIAGQLLQATWVTNKDDANHNDCPTQSSGPQFSPSLDAVILVPDLPDKASTSVEALTNIQSQSTASTPATSLHPVPTISPSPCPSASMLAITVRQFFRAWPPRLSLSLLSASPCHR